jgi:hypothetical protein
MWSAQWTTRVSLPASPMAVLLSLHTNPFNVVLHGEAHMSGTCRAIFANVLRSFSDGSTYLCKTSRALIEELVQETSGRRADGVDGCGALDAHFRLHTSLRLMSADGTIYSDGIPKSGSRSVLPQLVFGFVAMSMTPWKSG